MKTELWKISTQAGSRPRAFMVKYYRILLLTLRGFQEDQCQLRASALTLYSLLSVVPVMAMAFGIAKGFGFEKMLEKQLLERIPGQEQSLLHIMDFARTLLENTRGGVIAGVGIVFLLWSVIKVLGNVESSFNHIWKIQEARSFERRFSDYLSIMLIAPILVIMSSSVSVFITTQVTLITEKMRLLEAVSPFILSSLKLLPYGIIWILFSFLYIFMPNTKVHFLSGMVAGIIAGTIYQLVQVGYIYFQVKIANYNAIYGSFAALPFFVLWLQLSWLVMLFGAEISFYHQHIKTYQYDRKHDRISPYLRKLFALRIVHLLVINFSQGQNPFTASRISHTLELPLPLLRQILGELVQSGIIAQTPIKNKNGLAYQPAKAIDLLTVRSVIHALEHNGTDDIPFPETPEFNALSEIMHHLDGTIEQSPANKLLREI